MDFLAQSECTLETIRSGIKVGEAPFAHRCMCRADRQTKGRPRADQAASDTDATYTTTPPTQMETEVAAAPDTTFVPRHECKVKASGCRQNDPNNPGWVKAKFDDPTGQGRFVKDAYACKGNACKSACGHAPVKAKKAAAPAAAVPAAAQPPATAAARQPPHPQSASSRQPSTLPQPQPRPQPARRPPRAPPLAAAQRPQRSPSPPAAPINGISEILGCCAFEPYSEGDGVGLNAGALSTVSRWGAGRRP